MEKIVVGKIEEHDVLYLPERDCIFCKNTVIPFNTASEISKSSLDRYEVPEKNLVVKLFPTTIELGCLTTTRDNYESILKQIKRLKH